MLTGVREAVRALSLLRGDDARFGAAAAEDVATGPLVKRRAVRRSEVSHSHTGQVALMWPAALQSTCSPTSARHAELGRKNTSV